MLSLTCSHFSFHLFLFCSFFFWCHFHSRAVGHTFMWVSGMADASTKLIACNDKNISNIYQLLSCWYIRIASFLSNETHFRAIGRINSKVSLLYYLFYRPLKSQPASISAKKKRTFPLWFIAFNTYPSSDVKHMIKTNTQHSLSFTSLGIIPH